jgi:PAS domain S-box-containing protein
MNDKNKTELKLVKEIKDLQKNNENCKNLIESANESIISVDAHGKTLTLNSRAASYLGGKTKDFVGKSIWEIFPPKEAKERYKDIQKVIQSGKSIVKEVYLSFGENQYCFLTSIQSIKNKTGDIYAVLILATDITQQKKTEKALYQSQETYRTVFENTGTATIIIEEDMTISLANSQAANFIGYTKGDIENKMKWTDFVLPEELERMKKHHLERREKGETPPAEYEFRLKDREGHTKDISLKIGMIPHTKKSVASLTDITHRKQIAESLKKSEELLKRTERISKIGGWEFDIREKKITWTDEVYRIYGVSKKYYNPNDVRQDISFYAPKDQKKIEQALQEAIEKGKPYDLEFQFISAKGQHRWVRTTGEPLKEDKKVTKVVGNFLDITRKKKSEQKIRHLNQVLRAIRNVNQLIIKEEDRNKLIQKACNILVKTRGYQDAWIALLDEKQNYLTSAEAGLEQAFLPLKKLIQNGQYPRCVRKSLDQKEIVITKNTTEECQNCPLLAYHKNRSSYTACLKQNTAVYGFLSVCIPTTYMEDKEEQDLFRELTKDVSFALYTIEAEKTQKQVEEALRQSGTQYRQLVDTLNEGIWRIDAEGGTIFVNPKMAEMLGYKVNDMDGKHFFDFIDKKDLQNSRRCIEKCQQGITEQHEFTFRKKNGELLYTLVNTSPIYDEQGTYIGVIAGITDISLRKQAEARVRKSLDGTIQTLSKISETRDPYTAGHQDRVSQLAIRIARGLHLKPIQIEGIKIASLIHDIGKIGIPSEILTKPSKLSEIEFSLIKGHSQIGYDILKDIDFPYPIAQIVLQHHERINGSGYPNHLKGPDIILEAKVLSVADVVEAMSSHRPYRAALGIDAALEEITKNKGILYDPEIVDVCVKLFKEKGFKFE